MQGHSLRYGMPDQRLSRNHDEPSRHHSRGFNVFKDVGFLQRLNQAGGWLKFTGNSDLTFVVKPDGQEEVASPGTTSRVPGFPQVNINMCELNTVTAYAPIRLFVKAIM